MRLGCRGARSVALGTQGRQELRHNLEIGLRRGSHHDVRIPILVGIQRDQADGTPLAVLVPWLGGVPLERVAAGFGVTERAPNEKLLTAAVAFRPELEHGERPVDETPSAVVHRVALDARHEHPVVEPAPTGKLDPQPAEGLDRLFLGSRTPLAFGFARRCRSQRVNRQVGCELLQLRSVLDQRLARKLGRRQPDEALRHDEARITDAQDARHADHPRDSGESLVQGGLCPLALCHPPPDGVVPEVGL